MVLDLRTAVKAVLRSTPLCAGKSVAAGRPVGAAFRGSDV